MGARIAGWGATPTWGLPFRKLSARGLPHTCGDDRCPLARGVTVPTPQITLRVDEQRMALWKTACSRQGTNVSEQIRLLMDAWTAQALAADPVAGATLQE